MTTDLQTSTETTPTGTADVDVLIVGAGISGIGCAWHLQHQQPGKTFRILEARDAMGGTWDLFRYPGIRSDSDLHTFGYVFKPWTHEKSIADGPDIRGYIEETARENGIDRHITYGKKVVAAEWSSADALWTTTVEDVATGETTTTTSRWLFSACGYYRYDEGFTPHFEGTDRFQGQIIHPQHWPEDLDYAGKKVVVIGSGATAVTLVPAMAEQTESITMLQRSPSYILPLPSKDPIANVLRAKVGEKRAYAITRKKNIYRQMALYGLSKRFPNAVRKIIRKVNEQQLKGSSLDVDVHFKPTYDPWDQRLCAVPDADLYRTLRKGKATVVTDHIDTFDETGIRLKSGKHLDADIIVTATGLNLLAFGGIALKVDGEDVSLPDTVAYKSFMLSGVPNFAFAVGYTNSSWTLKVDLVCEHLAKLIGLMDARGADAAVPQLPESQMEKRPLLDFKAGYVLRSLDSFPKQGVAEPWSLAMSYAKDAKRLQKGPVEDPHLRLFSATREAAATPVAA